MIKYFSEIRIHIFLRKLFGFYVRHNKMPFA